jgi:hypothetical protein
MVWMDAWLDEMDAKDGRTPIGKSSKQNQKTILRNLNMHNSMGMGMEHATHGDHQAAVELPTLFATVSSDGQHIRLEEDVFVRRILRSFSRRTLPSVEVFVNTYQTMEVGEYRAGSLHEYAVAVNEHILCAQSRGGARCKVGIGTLCHYGR